MSYLHIKSWLFSAILAFCLLGSLPSQAIAQTGCPYNATNMTDYFELDARPVASSNPDECCFEVYLVNTSDCIIWYYGSTRLSTIGGEEGGGDQVQKGKVPSIQATLSPGQEIPLPWPVCIDKDDFPVVVSFEIVLQQPGSNPPVLYKKVVDLTIENCEGDACCPDLFTFASTFDPNIPGCCGVHLTILTGLDLGCRYNAISIIEDGFGSEYVILNPGDPILNHPIIICNDSETIIEIEFIYYSNGARIVRCKRNFGLLVLAK